MAMVQHDLDHNVRYTCPHMAAIWRDIGDGFYNFGKTEPDQDLDKVPDLVKPNNDMIDFVIEKMQIDENSHILDCGTGPGEYLVSIVKKTGCTFTATDYWEPYLKRAEQRAREAGVLGQGRYLLSSWANMNPKVKDTKYTHILSLMTMYYGHDCLDTVYQDLADVSTPDTKIFVEDFVRRETWENCHSGQKHLRLPHPLCTSEELFEKINESRLKMVDYEDFTRYIIPGYKIMERECLKRDPELKNLTYPFLGRDFAAYKIACVIYTLKLRQPN